MNSDITDQLYRRLVQGVHDYAIYMLDPNGIVLNWNSGAERAKGYEAAEIIGQSYSLFYSTAEVQAGVPFLNLEIAGRRGHFQTEGWRYRKDGTAFWASVAIDPIYEDDGALLGFAKVTRDLTEQRKAARRMKFQASHDGLTGLLNFVGIREALDRELAMLAPGSEIAVHYIDLDRFKPVNDAFGHLAGDYVLKEAACRLNEVIGPSGVVGRLGGDEFIALQFGTPTLDDPRGMGQSIVTALGQPFELDHRAVTIGASIGVATAPFDAMNREDLYRCADLALYAA